MTTVRRSIVSAVGGAWVTVDSEFVSIENLQLGM